MRTVTAKDVLGMLTNIVERFGTDHIARAPGDGGGCTYAARDALGNLVAVCIVGQVFFEMGIFRALFQTDDLLLDVNDQGGTCALDHTFIWPNAREMGFDFDEDAKEILYKAQSMQDSNQTWGTALREATIYYRDALVENTLRREGVAAVLDFLENERNRREADEAEREMNMDWERAQQPDWDRF